MTIFLSILCVILIVCLCFSYWYIRQTLNLMYQITQDVQKMQDDMEDFALHLQNVYEMEMYYGDETLKGLIDHSKNTLDGINAFKNIFTIETNDATEKDKTET
tara:strand:- start:177 stop:485 length:309 start_codon:yes stop_codon:yes gene_type:complete